ncbi:hypothetical protein CSC3H3_01645 [Thalassospira marina]|uniref:Uncharacterized protein n=1 Tax=Thalassospira marina TaxID=2048283 RepID=A0ABM6Q6I1_9PROT|nr:hypothetical protein CSC3H3_01645 [Thalassospira marina]
MAVHLLKLPRFARIGDQPCDQRDVKSINLIKHSAVFSSPKQPLRKILYLANRSGVELRASEGTHRSWSRNTNADSARE